MDRDPKIIQNEVDEEIISLEQRYNSGQEDTDLYKLKISNLKTMKKILENSSPKGSSDVKRTEVPVNRRVER